MSELTQCNYCTLLDIKRRYGAENVTVILETTGQMIAGQRWLRIEIKGQTEPVAWFAQLTAHCVC